MNPLVESLIWIVVGLVALAQYHYELFKLGVKVYYFPFGYRIALSQIGIILSLGIITVLLFRRFLGTLREREQLRLEFEHARQVQSLLVPENQPDTPGFSVNAVYHPASQVGGDFFQIRPYDDGSLLLAVGDVSGKGLQAALTVSTIMGALRNETSHEPAQILTRLNHVLFGQISGFVTCCAVVIAPDGRMHAANAGHLAPYVGGNELKLDNGIPLGLQADATYGTSSFQLENGSQLTLLTDGVVEARNRNGELFGFERTSAISTQLPSAIAQAAQAFGQDDDITVLTLRLASV